MNHALPRLCLIATLLALPGLSTAQETTSQAKGISTEQDATTVALRITQLQAQLEAVEKETLRRLQCQANTQVSTSTGCKEVPGLREHAQEILDKQGAH